MPSSLNSYFFLNTFFSLSVTDSLSISKQTNFVNTFEFPGFVSYMNCVLGRNVIVTPSSSLKFTSAATLLPIKQSFAPLSKLSSKLFLSNIVFISSYKFYIFFFASSVVLPTSPFDSIMISGVSANRNLASLSINEAESLYLKVAGT